MNLTTKQLKEFKEYFLSFYGKDGLYSDTFKKIPTDGEINKAIEIRLRGAPAWDGDTLDRELVRDILLSMRGHERTEHVVLPYFPRGER